MRVSLLVVGRPRASGLADAIRDYESRIAHYWPFEVVEVKEESARGASADHVRAREAERLAERLPSDAHVVLCDPGAEVMDSPTFATWLAAYRDRAQSVAFVIGGAYGVGDPVRRRTHRRLSLAPWTLPHELARLVLVEQLYRAGTIVRGEPYHK
ncbi:MAG: 23S rRNA (pseudouridine(1915)-N(3))-methyltransferase RlmH [Gemmatimonadaceae bacterium]|nr:23S rRNA (pseudouridine(1915)-N(3))-methyltransferase RlmH [Gemmatimonadaceae bacterium]